MKGEKLFLNTRLTEGCYIEDNYYHECAGCTRYSLQFWEVLKRHSDFSVNDILGIEMSCQEHPTRKFQKYSDWYILTLWLTDNRSIHFKGFSSGYHGEGSRGTEKILKDLGLTEKEYSFIFEKNNTNWSIDLVNKSIYITPKKKEKYSLV